jgi:Flp pilus assembly protein TadG
MLNAGCKGTAKAERGQATLEFALVSLFLFLILFGIIDFSRLFFAYATMSHGVREAARFGIVHPEQDEQIRQVAQSSIVLLGGTPVITVEYPGRDDDTTGETAGCVTPYYCRIRVRAVCDLNVWTPVIPSVRIEAQATMHFE